MPPTFGSANVADVTSSAPTSATASGLSRRWWAYGLTLRERLGPPD
ncbi:hypothetical protein GA0115259_106775, partial [Streptomyces sp. MnatMP-M17]